MRTLNNLLEGIMDSDFDLSDDDVISAAMRREVFLETADEIEVKGNEVWVSGDDVHIDTDRLKKYNINIIHSKKGYISIPALNSIEDLEIDFQKRMSTVVIEAYGDLLAFKNIKINNCASITIKSSSGVHNPKSYIFDNVEIDTDLLTFGQIKNLQIKSNCLFKKTTDLTFQWVSKAFERIGDKCIAEPNNIMKALKLPKRVFPKINFIGIRGTNRTWNYNCWNSEWSIPNY